MVFFFQQKPAYEVRMSDGSSDVCSTDRVFWSVGLRGPGCVFDGVACDRHGDVAMAGPIGRSRADLCGGVRVGGDHSASVGSLSSSMRSEEHTSELQSLMRISYAVFCLKKKKQVSTINSNQIMI